MYYLILAALLVVPSVTQAQGLSFKGIVANLLDFGQVIVLTIFALSFLVVLWKIIETWILKGGEPEARAKGKKVIITSIIVLVVMSGLWGILELLINSFKSVTGL